MTGLMYSFIYLSCRENKQNEEIENVIYDFVVHIHNRMKDIPGVVKILNADKENN